MQLITLSGFHCSFESMFQNFKMFWILLIAVGLLHSSESRSLSLADLQTLVEKIGDEIVTHDNLPSAAQIPEAMVKIFLEKIVCLK